MTRAEIVFDVGHSNNEALQAIFYELEAASIDSTAFHISFSAALRLQCALYHYTVRESICYPPEGLVMNPPVTTQLYRTPEELGERDWNWIRTPIPADEPMPLGTGLGIGVAVLFCMVCSSFAWFV